MDEVYRNSDKGQTNEHSGNSNSGGVSSEHQ